VRTLKGGSRPRTPADAPKPALTAFGTLVALAKLKSRQPFQLPTAHSRTVASPQPQARQPAHHLCFELGIVAPLLPTYPFLRTRT
jgi:hypothetical protein